ncbi:MAG: oxygenase MpaB family protein [Candidatus Dormibacteria bacterium]
MKLPASSSPVDAARAIIARGVYGRIGAPGRVQQALREPAGDPGLFGPDSMVWRVHADLPSMLIGGISALMLQTLHPLAMAGVDQHSNFREDAFGRLRNTSEFIALTSFGSRAGAEEAISRVRRVHRRVRGEADDGRHYAAGDPALLTWVHVALSWSFLHSYQAYAGSPLTASESDRYYYEISIVAYKLGAQDVPRSAAEVAAYVEEVRPELKATPAGLEAVAFLMKPPDQTAAEKLLYPVLAQACLQLLPQWAQAELGMKAVAPLQAGAVRKAAGAIGTLMRWGVGTPMSVRWAAERVAEA